MNKQDINISQISQIRQLVDRYEAMELEGCIQDTLQQGICDCLSIENLTEGVSILTMAGFVRSQMEQEGVSVLQALRILGQRMRRLAAMDHRVRP